MRILVVSDLHGDLAVVRRLLPLVQPDLLLSCGDWGDPDEVSRADMESVIGVCPVHTTFGNHDATEQLSQLYNQDGSRVLIEQGEVREIHGLRLAAIGGIWAKSHRLPYYVTDADVADASARIAGSGPVDILLTHACPVGLADLTPSGRHGGQKCFLDAFKTVAPRLHLCGHLHVAQERTLKDGRKVINVGATPEGPYVVVDFDPRTRALAACLERLPQDS